MNTPVQIFNAATTEKDSHLLERKRIITGASDTISCTDLAAFGHIIMTPANQSSVNGQ